MAARPASAAPALLAPAGTAVMRSAPESRPWLVVASAPPAECPLCRREMPHPTRHHLIPASRGGRRTVDVCVDCHRAIHANFTHRELEALITLDRLLAREAFARMIRFIGSRPVGEAIRIARPRARRAARHAA